MHKASLMAGLALFVSLLLPPLKAQEPLSVQESDQNEQVVAELTRLSVADNIVTVRLKIRNRGEKSCKLDFYFKDIFLIDGQNSKKYTVLRDSDGRCIAGPLGRDDEGGRFEYWLEGGSMRSIWAKLPLPADAPDKVTLSVPGFLTFEGLTLPPQG